MLNFKEIKTKEGSALIYQSIQSEVVEFEPIVSIEELSKSYKLAQEESDKISHKI
jgi:hypothetical protein